VARLLATRPLRFLGDISYMLYLSHAYFLAFYDEHSIAWRTHPTVGGLYLRFATILIASLLWSALSLYLYERPIGRLRRYFVRPS
jgi:peptidoglycan/LPS O-acetylase OafA/YrhL